MLLPPSVQVAAAIFLADAPVDPTTGWLAYGPLGLMVAGFATRLIVPGSLYKDAMTENRALQAKIDSMYKEVMPAIEANTRATERALEALTKKASR
jgi:hypothetical protein